ncbi:MAG: YndM family protein, partial [Sporosarcina sp.]
MKTITALIIKFIMITAVLWIVLGLYGVSFGDILLTSVLLTGVSFIGDMYLVPRVKNIAATIADFGLAFVMIWLVGTYFYERPIQLGMAAFLSTIIIAAGEFIFHKYLQKQIFADEKVIPEKTSSSYQKDNLQTEFGSEFYIK